MGAETTICLNLKTGVLESLSLSAISTVPLVEPLLDREPTGKYVWPHVQFDMESEIRSFYILVFSRSTAFHGFKPTGWTVKQWIMF